MGNNCSPGIPWEFPWELFPWEQLHVFRKQIKYYCKVSCKVGCKGFHHFTSFYRFTCFSSGHTCNVICNITVPVKVRLRRAASGALFPAFPRLLETRAEDRISAVETLQLAELAVAGRPAAELAVATARALPCESYVMFANWSSLRSLYFLTIRCISVPFNVFPYLSLYFHTFLGISIPFTVFPYLSLYFHTFRSISVPFNASKYLRTYLGRTFKTYSIYFRKP